MQFCGGFEGREQEGLENVARADDPSGDAVDACVEEVEAEVRAIEEATAHHFLENRPRGIIEQHHVITSPAHAATGTQQQAGDKLQDMDAATDLQSEGLSPPHHDGRFLGPRTAHAGQGQC